MCDNSFRVKVDLLYNVLKNNKIDNKSKAGEVMDFLETANPSSISEKRLINQIKYYILNFGTTGHYVMIDDILLLLEEYYVKLEK